MRKDMSISDERSGPNEEGTLESSLLLPRAISMDDGDRGTGAILRKKGDIYRSEFAELIKLAYPMILNYLLEFGPGLVTIMLVGHSKDADGVMIDAAALAVMFVTMIGSSIGIGLATALDTLASQAFGACTTRKAGLDWESKQNMMRNRLCLYFQMGLIVLALAFIPVFFVCVNASSILEGLGQPVEVAKAAGQFVKLMLPGIPFLYLYRLYKGMLRAQKVVKPLVCVVVFGNIVNLVVGYILVFYSPLGWLGAAVARTCFSMSLPLMLVPYLIWSGLIETFWAGWKIDAALRGIHSFLELGVPGMLMLCFEWWAFEVITLISGLLPNAVLAMGANAVVMNVATASSMLYLGLSQAGNVRVGNALGAKDPSRAKVASNLTILLSSAMAMLNASLLLALRKSIPRFVVSDNDINDLATELMFFAAIFQVFDGLNAAAQGAFKGSGRHPLGAKLTFLAYDVIGLPLGIILAFPFKLGLFGLWIGMTAGLCFISLASMIIIYRTDWQELAHAAMHRLRESTPYLADVEVPEK